METVLNEKPLAVPAASVGIKCTLDAQEYGFRDLSSV